MSVRSESQVVKQRKLLLSESAICLRSVVDQGRKGLLEASLSSKP